MAAEVLGYLTPLTTRVHYAEPDWRINAASAYVLEQNWHLLLTRVPRWQMNDDSGSRSPDVTLDRWPPHLSQA